MTRQDTAAERPEVLLANSFIAVMQQVIERPMEQLFHQLWAERQQLNKCLADQTKILNSLHSQLAGLQGQLSEIAGRQQQLEYAQQAESERFSGLIQQTKLLENISRDNHLLGQQHYRQHIVEPMVRSVFPIFDIVSNNHLCQSHENNSINPQAYEIIDMVKTCLRQFLSAYQVYPIQHKAGSKFNPGLMKPVKQLTTNNPRLDKRVAKCLQVGFLYKKEIVLRFESVALYRYEQPIGRQEPKVEGRCQS